MGGRSLQRPVRAVDPSEPPIDTLEQQRARTRVLPLVSSLLIELSEQLGPALPIDYRRFAARVMMRVLREEGTAELLDRQESPISPATAPPGFVVASSGP